jgi:sterol desaturase/sphingolipid hydroxylase (fatty acid hydroxylase superfamily)
VPRDLRWNWLLLMLALAVVFFAVRKGRGAKGADGRERQCGFVEYLLPRDIYTHVSARVDVWLWIFERALKPVWALLLLGSLGPFIEKSVIGALTAAFGEGPAIEPNLAWTLFYSFVLLIGYDFTFFLLHYSEHKIPALWAIHKVHPLRRSADAADALPRARARGAALLHRGGDRLCRARGVLRLAVSPAASRRSRC